MGKNNGSSRHNHMLMERDERGHFVGKLTPTGRKAKPSEPVMQSLTPERYHAEGYKPWRPVTEPPLGTLTVTIFGEPITLTGGPYRSKPQHMFGVKMAAEIDHDHDVSIPTRDFQVPPRDVFFEGLLATVLGHFVWGDPIYVGCMGGRGRTGLFMATLAYLCGEDEPVKFVRANYYPHAVETREQETFVTSFDRQQFRRQLMKLLIGYNAVSWSRLRRMPLQDKLLWLKLVFAK